MYVVLMKQLGSMFDIHSHKALLAHIDRNSILQLMEICGMHIQGTKLPFHHIPKMLYWV